MRTNTGTRLGWNGTANVAIEIPASGDTRWRPACPYCGTVCSSKRGVQMHIQRYCELAPEDT